MGRLCRDMPDKRGPADVRIAQLAARQHGAVTSAQLREAGLSRDAVLERRRSGRLHSLHRGVYAVGHIAPSIERRWMAAVLALSGDANRGSRSAALGHGGGGVLSHRSAAELWGLLPPSRGPVDVSLLSRSGRRQRREIRIHRPTSLEPTEVTRNRGIPVTSPARTLADLRATASAREQRRAIRQAEVLGLFTGPDIAPDRTRSELERQFLRLCRRHRLPMPDVNMRIGALTVDFCWAEQKLVVETDGYKYHRGRAAFENDRVRDLELHVLGYEVLRLSYRQVFDESVRVAEILRATLDPGRVCRDIPD